MAEFNVLQPEIFVVWIHLNRLDEAILMRTLNIA